MIIKEVDPRNSSRLNLRLTPKGETANMYHKKIHNNFDDIVNDILKDASDTEKSFLKNFLNSLEEKIDTFDKRKKQ
ncbi:hypothetical protein ACI7YW_17245 [Clostridium ljungdahlii]